MQTLNTADETAIVQSAPCGVPSLYFNSKTFACKFRQQFKNLLKREGSLGSICSIQYILLSQFVVTGKAGIKQTPDHQQ